MGVARLPRPLHEAVVGHTYDVPCIHIVTDTVFPNEFLRVGEFVPVMLPAHEDADYFEFPHVHYHVDFRFVTDEQWDRMKTSAGYIHACIITLSLVDGEPFFQPLPCLRPMPDFPTASEIERENGPDETLVTALRGLEDHYQHVPMDTGTMVCPHRGVCLKGLPATDGVVVCPAHGLAWHCETGELVPRHS